MIINDFGAKVLPLSISYKCSKSVVEEANEYMPDITAFENSPEGLVETLDKYDLETFSSEVLSELLDNSLSTSGLPIN